MSDRAFFWVGVFLIGVAMGVAIGQSRLLRAAATKCNATGGLYIDGLCQRPARTAQ